MNSLESICNISTTYQLTFNSATSPPNPNPNEFTILLNFVEHSEMFKIMGGNLKTHLLPLENI